MDNLAMQKTLPITENDSFENILTNKFPEFNIDILLNKRMKKGWRIERKRNKYSLIVPSIFVYAPNEIKIALIKWAQILVSNKFSRKKGGISAKKQIKDLENEIYNFLKTETGTILGRRTILFPQKKFAETQGNKHNLRDFFEKLNNEHFSGDMECFLRWGKEKSRTSYHTICNDENGNSFHLITIAGVYNQKDTPEFALESVMYHEMLHIAFPPIEIGTKRNVHHKKFREMERDFYHYQKWKNWQSKIRTRR